LVQRQTAVRGEAASAAFFLDFKALFSWKQPLPPTRIDHVTRHPYHQNVQPVISAEQMRQIDRLTIEVHQTPSFLLMQSAAQACLQAIRNRLAGDLANKKVLVLCGPGNNGGDGAALAQLLSKLGAETDVILFGGIEDSSGDARTNFEAVRHLSDLESGPDISAAPLSFVECPSAVEWKELATPASTYNVIVDALFGTGLSRPLDGVFLDVLEYLKQARTFRECVSAAHPIVLSIDLPSGLNADLAVPIGKAVQADLTVTFTAPKRANVLPPASHLNGKLIVADIGSPLTLIEDANSNLFVVEENDVRQWLIHTRYTPDSFKNTHGHVLVIAGSRGYTGAAVLCGNAAMRSGAGLVTIATPASAQSLVASAVMPEVMTTALAETDRGAVSDEASDHLTRLASKSTVIAIGPGLSSEDERTRRLVYSVVKQRKTPVVIDADGLNCLAPWPNELQGSERAPLVLTPHPGEMLRLLGSADKSLLDDRVTVAREFATSHKLILVLKGSRSLIATPDGRVFINPTGNAGLGTAGAGDTLTGLIAGFLAQSAAGFFHEVDALFSIIAALYVGGLAGDFAARDLGVRTMVASDIREHLGEALCSLDPRGESPDFV
jgi:hydroxyethylthiazole kinase-like uncharacterized protein yjeF